MSRRRRDVRFHRPSRPRRPIEPDPAQLFIPTFSQHLIDKAGDAERTERRRDETLHWSASDSRKGGR